MVLSNIQCQNLEINDNCINFKLECQTKVKELYKIFSNYP